MPTEIPKRRTWCKTCQDFSLFTTYLTSENVIVIDTLGGEIKKATRTVCMTCDNEYVPYRLSEVPEEKLIEQRARYRQMKKNEFIKMLNVYQDMSRSNILASMMGELYDKPVGYTVREDDAGQEEITAAEKAEREARWAAEQEFKDKYHGAQRNDKCRCDSGLKYKKCCLPKVEKIR